MKHTTWHFFVEPIQRLASLYRTILEKALLDELGRPPPRVAVDSAEDDPSNSSKISAEKKFASPIEWKLWQ